MTTTAHRDCIHPKTKAARAKCRANRKKVSEEMAEWQERMEEYDRIHLAPIREKDAARAKWEAAQEGVDQRLIDAAEGNADDTSVEQGFEVYSTRWYEFAVMTLEDVKANADYYLED